LKHSVARQLLRHFFQLFVSDAFKRRVFNMIPMETPSCTSTPVSTTLHTQTVERRSSYS